MLKKTYLFLMIGLFSQSLSAQKVIPNQASVLYSGYYFLNDNLSRIDRRPIPLTFNYSHTFKNKIGLNTLISNASLNQDQLGTYGENKLSDYNVTTVNMNGYYQFKINKELNFEAGAGIAYRNGSEIRMNFDYRNSANLNVFYTNNLNSMGASIYGLAVYSLYQNVGLTVRASFNQFFSKANLDNQKITNSIFMGNFGFNYSF